MTDHARAKELFLACCELPIAGRGAHLDAICAGDGELRALVERMLAFDARSTEFLEGPGVVDPGRGSVVGAPVEAGTIQKSAGSYELQGEIARGGMGIVLKGHDAGLGRDVAIKLLPARLSSRPELLRRFVEEAQIAGRLQHPGIVPVYDLGEAEGRGPYFAMKLIEGRTLAELCAERPEGAAGRRRLLGVFEAVCQTVAYAHKNGVIHRDLKPANVMVGSFGEVHVLDWGIAKVLGASGEPDTESGTEAARPPTTERAGSGSIAGTVLGTPAYMPPEQARGEVHLLDERCDVFALGAVLCEILTGAPPYVGPGRTTLLRAAAADLAEAEARLAACSADAELVSIARLCLRPARELRPRDARAVAELVGAHLTSVEERARRAEIEAVEARVKAAEERRARRLTVGLAVSVLSTVLLGGGGWVALERAQGRRRSLNDARIASALDEAAMLRARESWLEAAAAAERASALAENGDTSEAVRERAHRALEEIGAEAQAARARAELARENSALLIALQEVRRPEGDRYYPTDWQELDRACTAVLRGFGHELDAGRIEEATASLARRGIGPELAAHLDEWSHFRAQAGDAEGGERLRTLAGALDADAERAELRAALARGDRAAVLELARRADPGTLPAASSSATANALLAHGDRAEALALLRAARLAHPRDFVLCMTLGRALRAGGEEERREAARHFTAALSLGPQSVEARHELGRILEELGELARAEECVRAALALRPDDAHLHYHLGLVLRQRGEFGDSVAACRRSVELDPSSPNAHNSLGIALDLAGDLAGARDAFRSAIELDPRYSSAWTGLGGVLGTLKETEEAMACCRRALALDPDDASAHCNLGNALVASGELDEALASYLRSLELDPELEPAHIGRSRALNKLGRDADAVESYRAALLRDPGNQELHVELGTQLQRAGDLDGAIESFERGLELDPRDAHCMSQLGWARALRGEGDAALELYERALALDPRCVEALCNWGVALASAGDWEGAREKYVAALEWSPDHADVLTNLGQAEWRLGRLPEATAALRRAAELAPRSARTHGLLGIVLGAGGELEEAIASFERAIRADPRNPEHRANLAYTHVLRGDDPAAIEVYRSALALDPSFVVGHEGVAISLARLGDPTGAAASWREVLRVAPEHETARAELGELSWRAGDEDAAVAVLEEQLRRRPSDLRAGARLAWALATRADAERRDPARALELARSALDDPDAARASKSELGLAWCALGMASYRAGALDGCIEALERALELDPSCEVPAAAFLAMAHARQGDGQSARSWLERARAAGPEGPGRADELARFHEEAGRTLAEEGH